MRRNADIDKVPWVMKKLTPLKYSNAYELCYWRKCWNIRRIVFSVVTPDADNDTQTPLGVDEMLEIATRLDKLNKRTWTDEGTSIWTWEEQRNNVKNCAKMLRRAAKLKKRFPHTEIYFYDSW